MAFKIIVNPVAGKGKTVAQLPQLQGLLQSANLNYEIELTKGSGHATEITRQAVSAGWSTVVAMGGDGTVNEVIQGLVGTPSRLAIIPAGTGNDLVRSLNLPRDLTGAVHTLRKHQVLAMDLGVDQGKYFASITGVGFPADVMYNVNLSKGLFSGSLAFVWGILKTLRELQDLEVELNLDGKIVVQKVQGVFVLNTVYAGGGLKLSPQADFLDGMLDVVVMRNLTIPELLKVLPKVYRGTHLSHPKVDFYRVRSVQIFSSPPVRKMFDGNVSGVTPIKAEICREPLRIIIPEKETRSISI